jgi:hypothetical protein
MFFKVSDWETLILKFVPDVLFKQPGNIVENIYLYAGSRSCAGEKLYVATRHHNRLWSREPGKLPRHC